MKKLLIAFVAVLSLLAFAGTPSASADQTINHAQPGVWYSAVHGGCWVKVQFGTFYVPYAKMTMISSSPSDPCSSGTGVDVVASTPGGVAITSFCTFGSVTNNIVPGCNVSTGTGYNGGTAWQYTYNQGTAIGMYVEICSVNAYCDLVLFSAF